MHYNKRTGKLVFFAFFTILLPISFNLHAANSGDPENQLDSVYNIYMSSHGKHTENNYNSLSSLAPARPLKCSFNIISYLRSNFSRLSLTRQKALADIMQRPSLGKSIVSPSGKFRIHYDESGDNIPSYDVNLSLIDNVKQVAAAFDSAYNYENKYLGYLFPPGDDTTGGDSLFDVYIINYNGHYYGETQSDDNVTDKLTSYIQIDNNYSAAEHYGTKGLNGMRVTAAHEFHHGIQIGCYGGWPSDNETFFYEMTSTSMEEFVYDSINDYYFYLGDYFGSPDKSLPQYSGYELVIWNIYLVQKYGFEGQLMIRRQWELKSAGTPVLTAINKTLTEKGTSFQDALDEFGVWTYFTGYRKKYDIKNEYFEEGAAYPVIAFNPFYFTSDKTIDFFVKPLSNNYMKFINDASSGITKDTIAVIATNSDYLQALNNPDQNIDVQLQVSSGNINGGTQLPNSNYFWKLNSSQINSFIESAILNNVSPTRRAIAATTSDAAYPVPFTYNRDFYILLPSYNNDTKYAEVKIFTVSMDLVYSGKKEILNDAHNQYVVNWNGLDSKNNKLSTGIYIFVTSSDDKIKMGKLVIKNE